MPPAHARDENKIVKMSPMRFRHHIYPLICLFIASGFFSTVLACDIDSDCGAGGTCIKREKRARGVCYGGLDNTHTDTTPRKENRDLQTAQPQAISPPAKKPDDGDAPIFGEEGYSEPSTNPRIIDRLDLPERTSGACITSTDCAGGQECIYRDPMLGHGTCEQPPN